MIEYFLSKFFSMYHTTLWIFMGHQGDKYITMDLSISDGKYDFNVFVNDDEGVLEHTTRIESLKELEHTLLSFRQEFDITPFAIAVPDSRGSRWIKG